MQKSFEITVEEGVYLHRDCHFLIVEKGMYDGRPAVKLTGPPLNETDEYAQVVLSFADEEDIMAYVGMFHDAEFLGEL